MRVLDRYILSQVVRPMVATILIALVALLAERTLRVVDLVVGWRGSLLVVVEMLGYLVPHYMGLAIPVAFFLGVLLTFDRLSKEAELAAVFAAGTGLFQLLRPLLLAALVLMGFSTLLASQLQPFGRYAYRAASYALTNASFYTLLQPGIFTTVGGTTYMAGELSRDKLRMGRVFLYHDDPSGGSLTVTAERGQVQRPAPMAPIRLELHDGVQQIVPASAEPASISAPPPSAKAGSGHAGSDRSRSTGSEQGQVGSGHVGSGSGRTCPRRAGFQRIARARRRAPGRQRCRRGGLALSQLRDRVRQQRGGLPPARRGRARDDAA